MQRASAAKRYVIEEDRFCAIRAAIGCTENDVVSSRAKKD
jgi:hypothetical protein